jgi:hypothetical protein
MPSGLLPPHYLSAEPLMELRSYVADYLKEEIAVEAAARSQPAGVRGVPAGRGADLWRSAELHERRTGGRRDRQGRHRLLSDPRRHSARRPARTLDSCPDPGGSSPVRGAPASAARASRTRSRSACSSSTDGDPHAGWSRVRRAGVRDLPDRHGEDVVGRVHQERLVVEDVLRARAGGQTGRLQQEPGSRGSHGSRTARRSPGYSARSVSPPTPRVFTPPEPPTRRWSSCNTAPPSRPLDRWRVTPARDSMRRACTHCVPW